MLDDKYWWLKAWVVILVVAAVLSARPVKAADPLPAALVVHAIDYGQTLAISDSCNSGGTYHEKNPILGRCPSRMEVSRYFAATAAAGVLLHYLLPEEYKPALSWAWLGIGVGTVARNYSIGVRIGF